MKARWFVGACAAALLSACGGNVLVGNDGEGGGGGGSPEGGGATGTTGTAVPPGEVTPACLDYCASVTESKACFGLEECHDRCMSFYASGCVAEVEVVLACLPEWLSEACEVMYANDPSGGCEPALANLLDCSVQAVAGCTEHSAYLLAETACEGIAVCSPVSYEVSCDDAAVCTCRQDGQEVGSCSMPYVGIEACIVSNNCCRAFFNL